MFSALREVQNSNGFTGQLNSLDNSYSYRRPQLWTVGHTWSGCREWSINQSTNQSINQSINQSVSQSINQSINQFSFSYDRKWHSRIYVYKFRYNKAKHYNNVKSE